MQVTWTASGRLNILTTRTPQTSSCQASSGALGLSTLQLLSAPTDTGAKTQHPGPTSLPASQTHPDSTYPQTGASPPSNWGPLSPSCPMALINIVL